MICALVESSFAFFAVNSFEKNDLYRKTRKGVIVCTHRGLSQPWLTLQPWLARTVEERRFQRRVSRLK